MTEPFRGNTGSEVINMASDTKKRENCLHGVRCNVESCAYHGAGNVCTAAAIDVRNENALTKAETFCGTFAPEDTWHILG